MAGITTVVIGLIIGYLGQRSRFCIISGVRDYYLVKDAYRLKGLLGVILGGLIGFSIVNLVKGNLLGFPLITQGLNTESWVRITLGIIGGFGMAFFSVQAEGCPFRQHVITGEGKISGILYLLGLVAGVIFFDVVVMPYVRLLTLLS